MIPISQQMDQTHKKSRSRDLSPFLIEKKFIILLIIALVAFPCLIAGLILLLAIFIEQELALLIMFIGGVISCIFVLTLAYLIYSRLKRFLISGSIFDDITRIIETLGIRIQMLIYPTIIMFFIFSIVTGGLESEGNTNLISQILILIGIALPFIAILLLLNNCVNYVNSFNNRIMSLDDIIPEEKFRLSIKDWGKSLGFNDVKVRFAGISPNYFGNVVIGTKKNGIVYLVFSKIANFQSEPKQREIFCVRELCRIMIEKRWQYYLVNMIHNLLFVLYLSLIGILVFDISSKSNLILISNVPSFFILVLIFIFSDLLFKVYLNSFDLLLELRADQKVVSVMKEKYHSDEIRRCLRLTAYVEPLISNNQGFIFRRDALLDEQHKKKINWDDL